MKKLLLILLPFLVISCFNLTGEIPPPPGVTIPSLNLNSTVTPRLSFSAYTGMGDYPDGQNIVLRYYDFEFIFELFDFAIVQTWNIDQPREYIYDDGEVQYTIQWDYDSDNNQWEWVIFDESDIASSFTAYKYLLVQGPNTYSFIVQDLIDDMIVVSGSAQKDFSSGQFIYTNPSTSVNHNVTWEPSTNINYDIDIVIISGLVTVTVSTTSNASVGEWTYEDDQFTDSGTWGQ